MTKNSAAPYSGAALCRSCELRDDVARSAAFKILFARSCPLWRAFAQLTPVCVSVLRLCRSVRIMRREMWIDHPNLA